MLREQERIECLRQREQIRQQTSELRTAKEASKHAKEAYLASRQSEVSILNDEVAERLAVLAGILEEAVERGQLIEFGHLRNHETFPPFLAPDSLVKNVVSPPEEDSYLAGVKPLKWFSGLIPGAKVRHQRAITQAEESYQEALLTYSRSEDVRKQRLEECESSYITAKREFEEKVQRQNSEVDRLEAAYKSGDEEAVVAFNLLVLQHSIYPAEFPEKFRVAYAAPSKQLVVERQLPSVEAIPQVAEFKYIKVRDEIDERARKQAEIRSIYVDLVASIALRTIHEIFQTKQNDQVAVVTFNGFIETVDPTTGQDITPHLISVRVTRDRFSEINLKRIEKIPCLRNLGANTSSRPDECLPVKPIVEFNMFDKRFVASSDLLTDLESRPNLMSLTPFEFEQLVGNLFSKMNLETRQTRTSRDGGVDVVAFDIRPVLGGKVVIQAKRYRHTVGVSAVRDLFGTMMNEGANKGILVTTSGYGQDAFDFAKDKPIELLDGGRLLYLLEEHAGVRARIIMPEEGQH